MREDFELLSRQGLPPEQIITTLADKYGYNLEEAHKKGKTVEDVLSDLIAAQPKSSSFAAIPSAIIRGGAAGLYGELPEMVGRTMQVLGIPKGGDVRAFGEAAKKKILKQGPLEEQKGTFEKILEEGASMIAPSLIPGIGSYALTRLVTAPKKALAISSALPAAMFGISAGQEAYEAGEKREVDPTKNLLSSIIQGLIEAGGEYYGTKALTKLFGLGGKEVSGITKKVAEKFGIKGDTAKAIIEALGVEAGTEVGQTFFEELTDSLLANSGKRIDEILADSFSVVPPTLVMTALTGGLASGGRKTEIQEEDRIPTELVVPPVQTAGARETIADIVNKATEQVKERAIAESLKEIQSLRQSLHQGTPVFRPQAPILTEEQIEAPVQERPIEQAVTKVRRPVDLRGINTRHFIRGILETIAEIPDVEYNQKRLLLQDLLGSDQVPMEDKQLISESLRILERPKGLGGRLTDAQRRTISSGITDLLSRTEREGRIIPEKYVPPLEITKRAPEYPKIEEEPQQAAAALPIQEPQKTYIQDTINEIEAVRKGEETGRPIKDTILRAVIAAPYASDQDYITLRKRLTELWDSGEVTKEDKAVLTRVLGALPFTEKRGIPLTTQERQRIINVYKSLTQQEEAKPKLADTLLERGVFSPQEDVGLIKASAFELLQDLRDPNITTAKYNEIRNKLIGLTGLENAPRREIAFVSSLLRELPLPEGMGKTLTKNQKEALPSIVQSILDRYAQSFRRALPIQEEMPSAEERAQIHEKAAELEQPPFLYALPVRRAAAPHRGFGRGGFAIPEEIEETPSSKQRKVRREFIAKQEAVPAQQEAAKPQPTPIAEVPQELPKPTAERAPQVEKTLQPEEAAIPVATPQRGKEIRQKDLESRPERIQRNITKVTAEGKRPSDVYNEEIQRGKFQELDLSKKILDDIDTVYDVIKSSKEWISIGDISSKVGKKVDVIKALRGLERIGLIDKALSKDKTVQYYAEAGTKPKKGYRVPGVDKTIPAHEWSYEAFFENRKTQINHRNWRGYKGLKDGLKEKSDEILESSKRGMDKTFIHLMNDIVTTFETPLEKAYRLVRDYISDKFKIAPVNLPTMDDLKETARKELREGQVENNKFGRKNYPVYFELGAEEAALPTKPREEIVVQKAEETKKEEAVPLEEAKKQFKKKEKAPKREIERAAGEPLRENKVAELRKLRSEREKAHQKNIYESLPSLPSYKGRAPAYYADLISLGKRWMSELSRLSSFAKGIPEIEKALSKLRSQTVLAEWIQKNVPGLPSFTAIAAAKDAFQYSVSPSTTFHVLFGTPWAKKLAKILVKKQKDVPKDLKNLASEDTPHFISGLKGNLPKTRFPIRKRKYLISPTTVRKITFSQWIKEQVVRDHAQKIKDKSLRDTLLSGNEKKLVTFLDGASKQQLSAFEEFVKEIREITSLPVFRVDSTKRELLARLGFLRMTVEDTGKKPLLRFQRSELLTARHVLEELGNEITTFREDIFKGMDEAQAEAMLPGDVVRSLKNLYASGKIKFSEKKTDFNTYLGKLRFALHVAISPYRVFNSIFANDVLSEKKDKFSQSFIAPIVSIRRMLTDKDFNVVLKWAIQSISQSKNVTLQEVHRRLLDIETSLYGYFNDFIGSVTVDNPTQAGFYTKSFILGEDKWAKFLFVLHQNPKTRTIQTPYRWAPYVIAQTDASIPTIIDLKKAESLGIVPSKIDILRALDKYGAYEEVDLSEAEKTIPSYEVLSSLIHTSSHEGKLKYLTEYFNFPKESYTPLFTGNAYVSLYQYIGEMPNKLIPSGETERLKKIEFRGKPVEKSVAKILFDEVSKQHESEREDHSDFVSASEETLSAEEDAAEMRDYLKTLSSEERKAALELEKEMSVELVEAADVKVLLDRTKSLFKSIASSQERLDRFRDEIEKIKKERAKSSEIGDMEERAKSLENKIQTAKKELSSVQRILSSAAVSRVLHEESIQFRDLTRKFISAITEEGLVKKLSSQEEELYTQLRKSIAEASRVYGGFSVERSDPVSVVKDAIASIERATEKKIFKKGKEILIVPILNDMKSLLQTYVEKIENPVQKKEAQATRRAPSEIEKVIEEVAKASGEKKIDAAAEALSKILIGSKKDTPERVSFLLRESAAHPDQRKHPMEDYQTDVQREVSDFITNLLGGNVRVIFGNADTFLRVLESRGITEDSLKRQIAKDYGFDYTWLKHTPFQEILKKTLNAATLDPKSVTPLIFINQNLTQYDTYRAGFHEVLEVLQRGEFLTQEDMDVLDKEFLGSRERAADAFSEYMMSREGFEAQYKRGPILKIFDIIGDFIRKIRNFFSGLGWRTSKDVFRDIASGKKSSLRREMKHADSPAVFFKLDAVADKFSDTVEFFKQIPKGVSDTLRDRRLGSFEMRFVPPQWMSNNISKVIFSEIEAQSETAWRQITELTEPIIPDLLEYKKKNSDGYKKLTNLVLMSDRLGVFFSEGALKAQGYTDEQITFYHKIKEFYDAILDFYMDGLIETVSSATRDAYSDHISQLSSMELSSFIHRALPEEIKGGEFMNSVRQFYDEILAEYNAGRGREPDSRTSPQNRTKFYTQAILRYLADRVRTDIPEGDLNKVVPYLLDLSKTTYRLEAQRAQYKKGFYFPRIRPNGDYAVNIYEYGPTLNEESGEYEPGWVKTERYHTNPGTRTKQNIEKRKIVARELKRFGDRAVVFESEEDFIENHSKLNRNQVAIVISDIIKTPPSLFEGVTNRALQNYFSRLVTQLEAETKLSPEAVREISKIIYKEMDEDLKSRSFARARWIARKRAREGTFSEPVVLGYETDLFNVSRDYVVSQVRNITRFRILNSLNNYVNLQHIKSEILSDKNLYSWYKQYIDAVMSPDNDLQRYTRALKSMAAFWYLGGRISSGLIQLTQAYVTGVPELAGFTDASKIDLLRYKFKGLPLTDVSKHIARQSKAILMISKAYSDIVTKNLTENEILALQAGVRSKVINSQYINSLMEHADKVLGFMTPYVNLALRPFQFFEQKSREGGFLAAYRLAVEKGLNHDDALAFATDFVNTAFHIYSAHNKPLVMTRKTGVGSALATFGALKGYQLNYVGWLYNAMRNTYGEHYADKLIFSSMYMMFLGGLFAFPLGDELIEIFSNLTGIPLKKTIAKAITKNTEIQKAVEFGIPAALLGIDVSGSIKLDLIPKELSVAGLEQWLLGTWTSSGQRFFRAYEAYKSNQYRMAIQNLAPVAVENIIKAVHYGTTQEPMKTITGKVIRTPEGKELVLSPQEIGLQLLGFRPTRLSEVSSFYTATKTVKNYWETKRNRIYTKIKTADSVDELSKILKEDVNEFNHSIARYGGAIAPITSETILQSMRTSKKLPSRLEMLMSK